METPRAPSETPRATPWAPWALVAITIAAFWLRLPGLTGEEPWFDEVFSIVLASQDLPELWRRAVADETNPPGFYLLLWGWTRLGGFELAWMRLLPLLAAVLTVPATALAARATGLGWTGTLVAAGLAASSPLMFSMGSELRAYAPLALAAALTLAAAARQRHSLAAVGGVALVLLHYFGALAVAAITLATLARARGAEARGWRPWVRDAAAIALAPALVLAAWVLTVVRASGTETVGSNAAWITAPGAGAVLGFASQVVGTFGTPIGSALVAAALIVATVLAIGTVASRARARASARASGPLAAESRLADPRHALALAILPLLAVALLSTLWHRELWVGRYLIITLPAWWVLLGHAVERATGEWREGVLASLLTWAALAGLHAERTRTPKTAWSLVARALTANGPRVICAAESYVALPLRYQALREALPLTVLDLDQCAATRGPDAMLLRVGTEAAIARVTARGARTGTPRELGTSLPPTILLTLEWPAR